MENEEVDNISNKRNRVLLVMDASNFEYLCVYAALADWKREYPDEAIILKPRNETDQDNLPDILVYDSYRRILSRTVQKKFNTAMWIAKITHPHDMIEASDVDVVLTLDDSLKNNFRKIRYPEYKSNRKLAPKIFDISKAKRYVQNVIFKELELEDKMGYRIIGVEGCESDDIIAVLMKHYKDYRCRILISSDRDFLQLENVYQYDWGCNIVKRRVTEDKKTEMTPKEFLLWKIVCGDKSDNIPHVFEKVGEMKSFKLINDKGMLKKMLHEDRKAAERFMLNKYLIDFNSIPSDVEERIKKKIDEKMSMKTLNEKIMEFSVKSCLRF